MLIVWSIKTHFICLIDLLLAAKLGKETRQLKGSYETIVTYWYILLFEMIWMFKSNKLNQKLIGKDLLTKTNMATWNLTTPFCQKAPQPYPHNILWDKYFPKYFKSGMTNIMGVNVVTYALYALTSGVTTSRNVNSFSNWRRNKT